MRTAWRLVSFLRPYSGSVLLSILVGVATTASGIGLLGTSAYLIASAALQPSIADLQLAIVGVRFFGISRAGFRYLERLITHSVNFQLLSGLRSWFFAAIEPLAPARLSDYQRGDLLQRAIGDIELLENFYVRVAAPPLTALIVSAGMGWYTGQYQPLLGVVLAIGLLTGMLLIPWLAYLLGRGPGKALVLHRSKMSSALVETIQGLGDLTAFGQIQSSLQKIEVLGRQLSKVQMRYAWGSGGLNGLQMACANLTMLGIVWLAVPLVRAGTLEGVSLAVLALAALASFEAVTPLPQAAQQLTSSLQAAQRLFTLADQPVPVPEPKDPAICSPQSNAIRIRGLNFRYAPDQNLALEGIDLDLGEGKKLGLVGPNGAGKSTLGHLLLRLWDYDQGSIKIGGCELRSMPADEVRSRFSVISQPTTLFSASLGQNLRLATPNAQDQDLMAALEQAGLAAWFSGLPDGLDTWIGEQGVQLSGGERQRLAVARAFLQTRPIVILDEPSAHLDAISEREVLSAAWTLFEGRSLVWITHRLVQMDRLDEILVMDRGRIVERGSHQALLSADGFYAKMWRFQQRMLAD